MENIAESVGKYTRYECKECGYTTEWPDSMETHMYSVHGIDVDIE